MIGLVCPFGVSVSIHKRDGTTCFERIDPDAFTATIRSLTTPDGKPIPLTRGHRRRRQKWVICDASSGLKLWSDERGLWLEAPGKLPLDFSGISISLRPLRWRRLSMNSFLLLESGIRHIALLTPPETPAYPQTFLASIKASMAEKTTLEV